MSEPTQATVLVTGATSGIGQAIATDLAHDHRVIAVGRDGDALAHLREAGLATVRADLTDGVGLEDVIAALPEQLAGLVHSAALGTPGRPDEATVEEWRRQFDVNVTAAAELTRLAMPALRAGGGTVVFVNSGAGLRAGPDMAVYAATKHALKALADSLRAAERGVVRIGTVYPGRTDTPMQRQLRAYEGGEYRSEDFLRPTSVAAAVRTILTAPPEAQITDLSIRPRYEMR